MTCDNEGDSIRKIFSGSIKDAGTTTMDGRVRAGDGEHFGWRDGISQPALEYVLFFLFPYFSLANFPLHE